LWSHSINAKKTTFERINYAVVTSIDGKEIDTATATPIEISASRHVVRIRYDRDTVLCGYLGCLQAKEGESSVEISVEAGHSYVPCTRNVCGKDWYWIDDQGKDSAEYMNSKGFHPKAMACGVNFFRNLDLPKVAAGEKPPDICEDGTNK
jgi:hypothetical protein